MKLLMVLATGAALAAPAPKPVKLDLKPGLALAFAAHVVEGKVILGAARAGKFGELQPNDGEIVVGLSPKDKTFYVNVVVTEKTAAPVDFLAAGFVGGTKIDEIEVKGILETPFVHHIGATCWIVRLYGFEAGKSVK